MDRLATIDGTPCGFVAPMCGRLTSIGAPRAGALMQGFASTDSHNPSCLCAGGGYFLDKKAARPLAGGDASCSRPPWPRMGVPCAPLFAGPQPALPYLSASPSHHLRRNHRYRPSRRRGVGRRVFSTVSIATSCKPYAARGTGASHVSIARVWTGKEDVRHARSKGERVLERLRRALCPNQADPAQGAVEPAPVVFGGAAAPLARLGKNGALRALKLGEGQTSSPALSVRSQRESS